MRTCIDKVCEGVLCEECKDLIASICGNRGLVIPKGSCNSLRFEGIEDTYINQGDEFDPTCGIKAYDGNGNEIEYTVEPSEIPSTFTGVLTLTYTAIGTGSSKLPNVCGENALSVSASCFDQILTATRWVLVRPTVCASRVCETALVCADESEFNPYKC